MSKRGFTILEVTLFLAISASLSLVAFAGLGPRLRNVRFTDSVRGLESSIKSNFIVNTGGNNIRSEIGGCSVSGDKLVVSDSPGVLPGSAQNCVSNGVMALFEGGEVKYRNIISLRKPSGCTPADLDSMLQCYKSTVLDDSNQVVYAYANGLTKVSPDKAAFVTIKDPETNQSYNFRASAKLFPYGSLANSFNNEVAPDYSFGVCYELDSRTALLTFANNSLDPKVEFKDCS